MTHAELPRCFRDFVMKRDQEQDAELVCRSEIDSEVRAGQLDRRVGIDLVVGGGHNLEGALQRPVPQPGRH